MSVSAYFGLELNGRSYRWPWTLETCASHYPILFFLTSEFEIGSAIELGMGRGSTPLLATRVPNFTTVEEDEFWFRAHANVPEHYGAKTVLMPKAPELAIEGPYDLALVDGSTGSRAACLARAMPRARFTVVHDTEDAAYAIDAVEIPEGYERADFTALTPWTTVISRDAEAMERVREFCS